MLITSHAAASAWPVHFANAEDSKLVRDGQAIYVPVCSSCHGKRLEGQALWQVNDQFAHRRAPAQDATGHTWQHSDDDLFFMTKFGRFPSAPPHVVSYMPSFAAHLTDHDIVAVIAFIKANWPTGIRASQAMLNPGQAGMPKNATKDSWTLPPNCTGTFVRWNAAGK
ncbi:MAG TPA: cytochrome c [Rhizomicrobium sp.]|jgi:mono/diheme cytochrome c family protein|nr:cytochrome c [Rhizomicrobium sp.]